MKSFAVLITISFCFLPNFSQAGDILALDFNFSGDEIEVLEKRIAEETALGKKNRLIVIPETSKEDRAQKRKLGERWEDLDREEARCNKNKTAKQPASGLSGCATVSIRRAELNILYQNLFSKLRLNQDSLYSALEKVCSSPNNIDRLFLTGHDGTGDFYGDLASLSLLELKSLSAKYPNCLKHNIHAAYFWGCYTGTTGKNRSLWPEIFPDADFVAGYDDLSPASFRPNNLATLNGLLKIQDQLIATKQKNKVKSLIKSVKDLHWHTGVYLRGCDFYYARNEIGGLAEFSRSHCGEARLQYAKQKEVFNCYWSAKRGCADVPENTGDSPLRSAYNFLQQSEECFEDDSSGPERPDTNRTIRLIFYKNVLSNIGRTYAGEISRLNGFLEKHKKELKLPNLALDKPSRQAMIEWAKSTRQFLEKENNLDWQLAKNDFFFLEKRILHLECIPFGWVEPNAMIPPSC